MFATDDTIVAIATPPGRGGIGVVRISGPRALDDRRADPRPARAARAAARDAARACAASTRQPPAPSTKSSRPAFPAPHSYTGEDVVEISAHGSPVVLHGDRACARSPPARGWREPGEFTLRAFLNGKRDLVQAEAVADLIDAATPLQARVAFDQLAGHADARASPRSTRRCSISIARLEASLDFPDEGYHFIEPAETRRARSRGVDRGIDALLGDARPRPDDPRGRDGRHRRPAERRQVEPVQRASWSRSRDRDRASPGTTRDLVTEPSTSTASPSRWSTRPAARETRRRRRARRRGARRAGARASRDLVARRDRSAASR